MDNTITMAHNTITKDYDMLPKGEM